MNCDFSSFLHTLFSFLWLLPPNDLNLFLQFLVLVNLHNFMDKVFANFNEFDNYPIPLCFHRVPPVLEILNLLFLTFIFLIKDE